MKNVKPSLAVISTVNASEPELEGFLRYHAQSDEIAIIVFLDRPEHMEYATVRQYSQRVKFVPCTHEHWNAELGHQPENMPQKQHTNIRAGARMAKAMGLDWAISIDNDEFIYPLKGIAELLSTHLASGTETIKLRPCEAVHDMESGFSKSPFTARYFRRRFPGKGQYFKAIGKLSLFLRLRLYKQLPMTRRGFWGHTDGKSIFNVHAPITEFKQHNQFSSQRKLVRQNVESFKIVHFDAINYEHWREKWYRRTFGSTRATAISPERARLTALTKFSLRWSRFGIDKLLFKWLYVFSKSEISRMVKSRILIEINCWDEK